MNRHLYIIFILSSAATFLFSCSTVSDNLSNTQNEDESINYDDIYVSSANLPLYANIGNSATKSITSSDYTRVVSLESLLDRTNISSKTFRQYELTEIPFKTNEDPNYALLTSFIPTDAAEMFQSKIALFLVETIDNDKNTIDRKVVTVIPDQEYTSRNPEGGLSFINKGVFSGTVLFSDLDGTFRDIYVYGGNCCPIINAEIIDYSQRNDYPNYGFLTLVNIIETRSNTNGTSDGNELEPSICIATKVTNIREDLFISFGENMDYDDIEWTTDPYIGRGGGSGGGSGASSGSGSGNLDDNNLDTPVLTISDQFVGLPICFFPVDEEVQKFRVSLYAYANGITEGSGEYQDGAYIICKALPAQSYVFYRWVGDICSNSAHENICVTSDIEATAYFHHLLATGPFLPCYDALKEVMNPLIEMTVAPSAGWNIRGGTFGKTRSDKDGNRVRHDGLDLYAEPGTPIYAMHDGMISDYQYCIEQPDRIARNEYPKGYEGDRNGAGNRIHVKCNINGEDVLIGYWHLFSNCPIALNPRTKRPFAPGDVIYQGELIGYTGKTGNCFGIQYYHLHLAVIDYEQRNLPGYKKYLNPENYINGDLDWEDTSKNKINSRSIKNIKCQELYEKISF